MNSASLSVSICVLASVAGSLRASTVEFRIVERRGQTSWNPFVSSSVLNDNIFNLAVQARVVGGTPGEALGNFGFNIIMPGEPENFGTLTKARISVANSANYDTSVVQFNNNSTIGQGGLAATYTYLAGIGGTFNGLINVSSGSWTQTSNQDIGQIVGAPVGNSLLLAVGQAMHLDGSGNQVPDTWVSGTTATLDPSLAQQFMGANGNFIDVYHFNYTISDPSLRPFQFSLDGAFAQTFTGLESVNDVWGPSHPTNATEIIATGALFTLVPSPAAATAFAIGSMVAFRRKRPR